MKTKNFLSQSGGKPDVTRRQIRNRLGSVISRLSLGLLSVKTTRETYGTVTGQLRATLRYAAVVLLFFTLGVGNVWGATATIQGTCWGEAASSYQTNVRSFTDEQGNTWNATGYGVTANTNIIIGKGGANYLETPNFSGNISSIAVTWSGNTNYYLALQTTDGTELAAQKNPSSATEYTFSVSGSYTQLRLVGRRSSGTSNAAATITKVVVTYGSSCTPLSMSAVTATAGDEQISLSWPSVANANSYTVTCKVKSSGSSAGTVGSVTGTTTKSCTITGLSNGTEYTWSVMPVGTGSYCADNTPATGDATPNVFRTITYYDKDGQHTTSLADGTNIATALTALYGGDEPVSCDATNYEYFVGWKVGEISGTASSVTLLDDEVVNASSPSNNYYAVWSDTDPSAGGSELFNFEGGTASALTGMTGVTAYSLGSDYAAGNAPYRVKLDGTGDYVIIAIASQPSKVTIGVKMIGGSSTSSITVQESTAADGTFTDVEALSISGAQNDVLTLETSASFKSTTRAVKLYFTKGSNVGLGPITIEGAAGDAEYITTCCTPLGTINGSINKISPAATEVRWNNVTTGVSSWTVKYKVHGAAAWTTWDGSQAVYSDGGTNNKRKVTITTTCNTKYDFLIVANPSTGYCPAEEELNNSGSGYDSGKWSVTYNLTDITKTSGPDAGANVCGAFSAVFAGANGKVLPATITVTIGDNSATVGTDYTWEDGELSIAAAKVTGDLDITVTGATASYQFWYGPSNSGDGWTSTSFVSVGNGEHQITNFVMPAFEWDGSKQLKWNVSGSGISATDREFYAMSFAHTQSVCGNYDYYNDDSNKDSWIRGPMPGAKGTLRIYDYKADNGWCAFIPNEYVLKFGSSEVVFTNTSGSVWETAVTALSSFNSGSWTGSTTYQVGVGDASHAFVAVSNKCPATAVSTMGYKTNSGENWETGLNNISTARGKFRIWIDNCSNNWNCHFVPYHRVVFHANWPVSGSPADTYAGETSVEESSGSIALASAPSAPTGYHFLGWFDAASGGNQVTTAQTISAGASADIELYAHWSNQTTITLNRNGKGTADGSATATYGSNLGATFTGITYTGTRYQLLGYCVNGTTDPIIIDAEGNLQPNVTGYTDASSHWICTEAAVELKAKWSGAGRTITWSANGSTYATTFVLDAGTIALPAGTPTSCDASDTHTYTTFIGWYTDAAGTNSAPTKDISDCGTKIVGGEACPGTDVTYYAVWGNGELVGGETKELTLDFTSNTTWQFPTDYVTSSSEASYTNTYTIKLAGDDANGYKWNSSTSSLIVGKEGAYLKLPAFSFATSKLVVTGPASGASSKVTWNVFVGSDAVSTEVTGANGENTFNIASANQAAGNVYLFKVTNGNNTQFKTIEVYSQAAGATGFISSCCASKAVINVTPTSSSLALDINGEASTTVAFGKTGTENTVWLMEPTITPETGSPADGASFSGWSGTYKTATYSLTFNATKAGTYNIREEGQDKGVGCSKFGTATITVAANPLIQTSENSLTVNGVCDDSGTPQTFTLNSRYLPDASKTLTITAATTSTSGGAYKVSTDGSTYSTSVNVMGGVADKATQTVYVRYEGAADEVNASLAGSVTISNGITSASVALSGACTCGTYVKLTPANATSTHILAPNGQWTRAQGVINIRANYLSSAAANVNIKLTSSNDKFKFTTGTTSGSATFESGKIVTATDNDWDGTVYIVYTPTSYNASESTTITAKVVTFSGTTEHAITTTTVYGRSFPETFVLAVNTGSSWVAVPADMIPPYGGSGNECSTGVGTHDPYPITVNDNANPTSASNVPARAIYKGASRNTPTTSPWTVQMESNSQADYYLWGSQNANTIADEYMATSEHLKWFAESSDLTTFQFHLHTDINTGKLGYNGTAGTIGQYSSSASPYKYDFRILPVSGDPCAYIINPVMTLDAYDGTTATVSIPYDGTTNYEISKDNKANWTDITGTIDCKKLTFSLPLATYKGTNIWLRADGTVCQGDATSVSSLHIPAPVITDPGAQHLYGVINVATSESFAVTGTDLYGTIAVSSSNPAITASYSEGYVTVNMAATATADDYTTTLTLSSVGAANVTVDVTITIRDLAEMTFSIEDLNNGKICANDLTYDAKFYVYLNGGSAVYRAADGSSLVNATSQISSCVFIRDLSINGDDNQTGFNSYSVTNGIASFYIPTTNLVPGHTYRISYYNSLANSGNGLFNSSRLGFADAHVDFVYSSDCTAPTAMVPCITSPTSVVTHWDDFDCDAPNTLQLNVFRHNDTEHANYNLTNASGSVTINQYKNAATNKWFTAGDGVNSKDAEGYEMLSTNSGNMLYSPTFANWWSSITAEDEVTITFKGYNYDTNPNVELTVQIYVVANGNVGNKNTAPSTFKSVKIDGVNCGNGVAKEVKLKGGRVYTEVSFTMKGVEGTDRFYIHNTYSTNKCRLTSFKMASIARDYVTGYDHKNVTGTSQEVTGLTANTTYYTTMNCGTKESAEVPFTTWVSSGSSYVKFYEDAGHTTEITSSDKIVVLGGQTTHVYMVGQKVPGCEVIPTVSSGYGLVDHTTYDPATGALGGYIDLTLTNPAVTSGTLTITDGTGTTYTRPIKSSDCPTDFETLALAATSITKNSATANWNSSANFEGVTEGTLYLYRDGVVDAEYITNEGFETGDLTGWNFLNVGALYSCDAYEVKSSNAHSGTHALYASDEGSIYSGFGFTTVIYGNPVTLPAGTYEMTSWVKVPVYSGYSDKHSYFKQGLAGCTLIGSTNETCYALSPDYTSIQSNNTYVQITDVFVLENPIKALPFVGHRADVGYTFHPFYLDDVSLKRISAPNAEEPDKVFPIANMSSVSSQALGTLSGNTQYTYLLKNANGCPSNSITFKTLQADGPTISAEDIEISAPAGSSATGVITVQVWDATAEISVSKGVASGSDQITLGNSTVAQEGGTIRVLFTPNTAPGSTGTCPVILNTRGLAEPVTVNINWTVTAGEDTDKPIVEVTEISNEWITIEHNVDAEDVRIVLNREKTAEEIETNVGDEIFFSKYYEAYSHKKLWAIFNPTNEKKSLAGMEVWRSSSKYDGWHSDVMDLSGMGNTEAGWIYPNEEIVVYTTNQVGTCEQNAVGIDVMSTWWQEGTSSDLPLSFSGDDALMLVRKTDAVTVARNNALPTISAKTGAAISWPEPYSNARGDWYMLDIIGGRTDGGNPSGKNIQSAWHWYNSKTGAYEDGDDRGWVGYGEDMSGDRGYNTSSEHPGYLLSTNRCLLVRAKSVTSGANAINSNIENMVTLNTEWQGSHVPTGGDQDAVSCSNFSFVGGYDYAGYYNAWTEIGDVYYDTDPNPDGSYTAEFEVSDYYCKTIHIEVLSTEIINGVEAENVHAYEDYKVPIVVDANEATTADILFTGFESGVCAECDVVIRDEAKLSHVSGGVNQFRNMIVYPGAKFDNSAKQGFLLDGLLMEAKNDEVGYAIINNNGSTIAAGKVVHVKRIDDQYWYPFSLPYDCDISAIRQQNGKTMGEYWEDWGIKYYDGAARQSEGSSAYPGTSSKYWKQMPVSGTLKANEAYIIGLFTTEWDGQFKSVYFPPKTTKEYTEAGDDAKTTDVYNWVAGLANDKRHHGWNFVGSPYISMFGSSVDGHGLNNKTNLILGMVNELTGEYEDLDYVYVSIPNGGNSKTYTQAKASATTIEPFKGYFVQTVDPTNGTDNTLNLTYQKADRTLSGAPARKATAQKQRVEVDLTVNGEGMSDIAGVVVDDCFTPEYEIAGDLTKMYAAAAKPQLYFLDASNEKMAYIALPDANAENVAMELYAPKAGKYTISLNEGSSRTKGAESIELLYNGNVVANLLIEDYTIEAAKGTNTGYSVRIRRAAQVTTSTETINGEHVTVVCNNGQISICNVPADAEVLVFDMVGKLMRQGKADGEHVVNIDAPQQGVYNIVIQSAEGNAAVKTFVR